MATDRNRDMDSSSTIHKTSNAAHAQPGHAAASSPKQQFDKAAQAKSTDTNQVQKVKQAQAEVNNRQSQVSASAKSNEVAAGAVQRAQAKLDAMKAAGKQMTSPQVQRTQGELRAAQQHSNVASSELAKQKSALEEARKKAQQAQNSFKR